MTVTTVLHHFTKNANNMKQLFFAAGIALLAVACGNNTTEQPAAAADTKPAATEAPAPTEIGDAALMEVGKSGIANLSKGDIAAWMNDFAEDAVYQWNNGDSLAGKAAISAYWTERRTKNIDSISFSKDVWLPLKVNEPQNDAVAPGTWLLSWYQVNAKYKNGARMVQWIHSTIHFNAAGKIDRFIQYLDREPINKAMASK
jgi:ketosteroid isomerase-like protein